MDRRTARWLPGSLFGRLVLVLAGGLLLAQLLSAAIMQVYRKTQELSDKQAAQQHQHQTAEQRAGQQTHYPPLST